MIDFPISAQDIAEMTGTTLHTVSRIMSAWEASGLVEGGRQRVLVRDRARLAALAEGADTENPRESPKSCVTTIRGIRPAGCWEPEPHR